MQKIEIANSIELILLWCIITQLLDYEKVIVGAGQMKEGEILKVAVCLHSNTGFLLEFVLQAQYWNFENFSCNC